MWFKDGSIILVTQQTGFRVHTSVLALHCQVFRDMIDVSNASGSDGLENDSEDYEGCPVIRLQDSPGDMLSFLVAMYHTGVIFPPGKRAMSLVVAGVLRLSTKYQAATLRKYAVHYLVTEYPLSLSKWKKKDRQSLLKPPQKIGVMLALATEADVRFILPAIYYDACRLPLAKVLPQILGIPNPTAQVVCSEFILGREKLLEFETKHVLAFLQPSFHRPYCSQPQHDTNMLRQAAQEALVKSTDSPSYQQRCVDDPAGMAAALNLCADCRGVVEAKIKTAQRKLWNGLPVMFGLPSWEKLREEAESLCHFETGDDDDDDEELPE